MAGDICERSPDISQEYQPVSEGRCRSRPHRPSDQNLPENEAPITRGSLNTAAM
jgi:hypothetical protein